MADPIRDALGRDLGHGRSLGQKHQVAILSLSLLDRGDSSLIPRVHGVLGLGSDAGPSLLDHGDSSLIPQVHGVLGLGLGSDPGPSLLDHDALSINLKVYDDFGLGQLVRISFELDLDLSPSSQIHKGLRGRDVVVIHRGVLVIHQVY